MATNLAVDPDLIERALEVSGERTKKFAKPKAHRQIVDHFSALPLCISSRLR